MLLESSFRFKKVSSRGEQTVCSKAMLRLLFCLGGAHKTNNSPFCFSIDITNNNRMRKCLTDVDSEFLSFLRYVLTWLIQSRMARLFKSLDGSISFIRSGGFCST